MSDDLRGSNAPECDRAAERMSRRAFGQAVATVALGVPAQTRSLESTTRRPAEDLCYLGAAELVRLMRRKQVSAREVMAAHLAQIERVNPKVNAIVTLVAERALADAARADEVLARAGPKGVLHGLPVAHKDLVDTAGIRTTRDRSRKSGSRAKDRPSLASTRRCR